MANGNETKATTHESYIQAVRALAIARIEEGSELRRLVEAKVVYGVGAIRGTRGVTFYAAWKDGETKDFIEVCASGEESALQIAGTTIHELAHVLAGAGTGHGKAWREAAARLGLTHVEAGGQAYEEAHFERALWKAIAELDHPTDGAPAFRSHLGGAGLPTAPKIRRCPMGIGTRGGTSRGTGSGSRLRLWICECAKEDGTPAVKVRIASDAFAAHCDSCGAAFKRGA
jgi:hypothetical protein